MKKKYVYALKTVNADMTSHNGCKWPRKGLVEAPDWKPTDECGNGLHAFLEGEGEAGLASWDTTAVWLVLKVDAGTYVDLNGKIKFPRCTVVHAGDRVSATQYLYNHGCRGQIIGLSLTGGYGSTLTGGEGSTLTGGNRSTLTGGDESTLTGGDWSTLTGGNRSTLTGGDESTLTGGYMSMLTGGDESTLTGGNRSTLTGGNRSTLTMSYYDGRKRLVTRYVGEDGIKPNTPYRLNDKHEFEEVKP